MEAMLCDGGRVCPAGPFASGRHVAGRACLARAKLPMASLVITTKLGGVRLRMRPDAAPQTVEYITRAVRDGVYAKAGFYRSDFVIQCGLHGTGVTNPSGDLRVNESSTHTVVSNTRGTASIAHWDVPDCGNTEFFINLGANAHLDTAYGGYCVFAQVEDDASFEVVDALAKAIKEQKQVPITSMEIC